MSPVEWGHFRNIPFPGSTELQQRVIINTPFKFGLNLLLGCKEFRVAASIPKPLQHPQTSQNPSLAQAPLPYKQITLSQPPQATSDSEVSSLH